MTQEPQEIDCQEVLNRLYEYLDGELTPVREAEVRTHLATCAPCMSVSNFERAYIHFLEARTRAHGAPESLKRRILEQILFEGDTSPTS
jgi:anti-sigma factor (TIGR02949 family)